MSENFDNDDIIEDGIIDDSTEGLEQTEPITNESESTVEDEIPAEMQDDFSDFLKSYGFEGSVIKYGDEDRDINSLTPEERLDIAKQLRSSELDNPSINEEDLSLIELAKQNNLTLKELMNQLIAQEIEKRTPPQVSSTMEDDELMTLHIKELLGDDASEEEIEQALEEKKNSKTYTKEIQRLREDIFLQEQAEITANQQRISETIFNLSDNLGLDEAETREYLDYMLTPDNEGKSRLERDFEDPETAFLTLVKANNYDSTVESYEMTLKEKDKEIEKLKTELNKFISKTTPSNPSSLMRQSNNSKPSNNKSNFKAVSNNTILPIEREEYL